MKRIKPNRLILIICILAFVATAAVAFFAFERLPHLEDEVSYLFQAKTMALGRLTVPSPAQPEAFWTPFVLDHQGQRFGKYAPGWPGVLAGGVLAGAPWLVNPLLAALSLYLVYRLGQTLYDDRTGLLAALLGLLSPLFLVLSGSFLSHLASLVWLLLFSLWFIWTAQGRSRWFALGSGLALGLAFLTRSLTAMAYTMPFVVYSLVQIVRRRHTHWSNYLLVALSGGMVAALLPLYQWVVTGDPWLNPYLLWWPYDRIGFGPDIGAMPGGHSPYYAWVNLKQDLSRAATDVLGWPALSWAPLVLGLALRPHRTRDWALLSPFACLVLAYLFYWIGSPARLWGPRYYFEGFGGLWLLGAVGLVKVWEWAKGQRKAWLRPVLIGVLTLMIAANLAFTLPSRMQQANGFYGITRSQLDPIAQADLHNALVIVYADRWLEYGAMLAGMSPLLNDDVVYARGSNPELDAAVIAAYPDRGVYYLHKRQLSTAPPVP
ncbi:MAG TPA: glycosyltransferase family 39 protein [Anaerolineae bacterium]|nr:glycosyltransferase family 39 protein [Anaerolineae bacterium]